MLDANNLTVEGEKFTQELTRLLGKELSAEEWNRLYVLGLGTVRTELYGLAQYFATEADRCYKVGTYFPACLMTASAIESLLAVLCLTKEQEVSALPVFRKFRGKGNFQDRVLTADFQNYVDVADQLNLVPSEAVATEIFQAAIQDFPLVAANLFPDLSKSAIAEKLEAFKSSPGIEMLRILQHMRNLVHGTRWSRLRLKLNPKTFEDDCKFVLVIATQVFFCLAETFIRIATAGIANVSALKEELSDAAWSNVLAQVEAFLQVKSVDDQT